jgi:acyl transferase domain-containing protein
VSDTAAVEWSGQEIAIVGMSGHFPGARTAAELWDNLRAGRDGMTRFDEGELLAAGVPRELLADPNYVRVGAVLDGFDEFDAGAFGYSAAEARLMDPQQRFFLEHCWRTLEDAGHDPARFDGAIGAFGGSALSPYLLNNVSRRQDVLAAVGEVAVGLANDKDSLTTRVAHVLGLTGPCFAVQSYCSTSLVAVCVAATSLANAECDLALAGGVSVQVPHRVGYMYQDGGMTSPDGRCRAFDAAAQGTPVGSGVAIVALRRLSDALEQGDQIYAVIRGWAVGNDGGHKAGFTAPRVHGQAAVVAEALASAGLAAADIDYVECHGTGTALGDAAELAALQQVFPPGSRCAIGSVKSNVGHLDRAAGTTGLIKTALALRYEEIPATLHFAEPNPQLLQGGQALEVVAEARTWPRGPRPRRAGVSAFGIGGTNAHVVLEEAPPVRRPAGRRIRPHQLLIWSARTSAAADESVTGLRDFLRARPDPDLADAAFTLQVGRPVFEHRRALVAGSTPGDREALAAGTGRVWAAQTAAHRDVGFLIAGAPPGRLGHTAGLYRTEPAFRAVMDEAEELLAGVVPPPNGQAPGLPEPRVFLAQYALGRLLESWGLRPTVILAAGIGELVAAALTGVLPWQEAVRLVSLRPELGPRLADWVAGHLQPRPVPRPYLSAATGDWLDPERAAQPSHWAEHIWAPSRLHQAVEVLRQQPEQVLVDFHSGSELAAAVRRPAAGSPSRPEVVAVLPMAGDDRPDTEILTDGLGRLWLAGVAVDWRAYQAGTAPRRTSLPTYPFQRSRHWIDPPEEIDRADLVAAPPAGEDQPARPEVRRYEPVWRPSETGAQELAGSVLIFADRTGIGDALRDRLHEAGSAAVLVRTGTEFTVDGDEYTVRPDEPGDYVRLAAELGEAPPAAAVHLWSIGLTAQSAAGRLGFYSACELARAIGDRGAGTVQFVLVTSGAQPVHDSEVPVAGGAMAAAAAVVVGQEYPNLAARAVDLPAAPDPAPSRWSADLAGLLLAELRAADPEDAVAYRDGHRMVRGYPPVTSTGGAPVLVRDGGTYLITGGLGAVGLLLARHLAGTPGIRLVLTSRHAFPPREQWEEVLRAQPDSATAAQVRAVTGAVQAGAEVVIAAVDAADPAGMGGLVATINRRYGRLDGVVHAAGDTAPDTFAAIRDLDRGVAERHFTAKVDGTVVLEEVLAGQDVDFCLLFSSISSTLGGIGFASYAAANGYLDTVPHRHRGERTAWLTVNWDTWEPTIEKLPLHLRSTMARRSIRVADALTAFDQLLAEPRARTVVAAGDVTARLREWRPAPDAAPGRALGSAPRPDLPQAYRPPVSELQRQMAAIWGEVLGIDRVGMRDNLFDLGGSSLLGLQLLTRVRQVLGVGVPVVALFEAPTAGALADHVERQLAGAAAAEPAAARTVAPAAAPVPALLADPGDAPAGTVHPGDVAIIGVSGRFPGAADVAAFWHNLNEGVESVTRFSTEELLAAGEDPRLVDDPGYVQARPVLDQVFEFDAGFFGYSRREAALADPQQRIFLECAWEALEQAGYVVPGQRGRVGVFGGTNISTYLLGIYQQLRADPSVSEYDAIIGNDKDALTTTVSYKLDLTGPSVSVQTFCSTSLVAVHLACQSLRRKECEMALAGGVSVRVPDRVGHLYRPGGMEGPEGHVRAFDADARGTLFGDGAAVVLLKPLRDALADRDTVLAVIRGSAINNDGATKAGYTAPSVAGQAAATAAALADAGVDPAEIDYVEAHGTATGLGDPVEIAALTRAFGPAAGRNYCAVGSVKTNVGHLERAAGTTALIKVVMAMRHGVLPATLHFQRPNPEIDFGRSPFFVNAERTRWQRRAGRPRLACVNALGTGGTNAHVVVQEAPPVPVDGDRPGRRHQIVVVSARSAEAVAEATRLLAGQLRDDRQTRLADAAYTLQVGRQLFAHRRVVIADSNAAAAAALAGDASAGPLLSRVDATQARPVGLLIAGVGEQYGGMVENLFREEPAFRAAALECRELLGEQLDTDVIELLIKPADRATQTAAELDLAGLLGRGSAPTGPGNPLSRTDLAQPAAFVAGYALARMFLSWGVRPNVMLGYSLGEYVAACLAGVLSLPDALRLVVHRARLIAGLPAGAMLAAMISEAELVARFGAMADRCLEVAVTTGSQLVVAGPVPAVEKLAGELGVAGVGRRILDTTHAFHTRMMEPVGADLTAWVAGNVTLNPPQVPYLSNVTGRLATIELVTDPGYWTRHMCGQVKLERGIATMLADPDLALVELGPGQSLGALVRAHRDCDRTRWPLVVPTLPAAAETRPEDAVVAEALAKLWLAGVTVDWPAYHRDAGYEPGRVPLPTYPFQRQEYRIFAVPSF